MSEKLCTLRKKGGGGGKYTETSLWTNSAPTSTFASQDVTLSDDINNYKYLKFTYRVTTSVADSLNYIISVSDFKKSVHNTSVHNCVFGLSTDDSSAHTRRVYYKTDTTVNFNNAYQLNAAASNNATVIPLEILGLNELAHGKNFNETTLWTNNSPTSAFAQQSVTLSDDFSNYDYIKINFRNNVGDATASEALISASAFAQTNDTFPNLTIRGRYSSTPYVRQVYRASANQITIATAYQMAGTGASNNAAIPTSIVGCKFR